MSYYNSQTQKYEGLNSGPRGGEQDYSMGCTCPDKEHLSLGAKKNSRTRSTWYVTMRNHNYSAFNGYRRTPSVYSEVKCVECGRRWRSKAKYVATLPDKPCE